MLKWFRSEIELRVSRNRIVLHDPINAVTCDRSAERPFSSEKLLVADRKAFQESLWRGLRELHGKRVLFRYPQVTIVAVDQLLEPVEREALYRAICEMGARKVVDLTTPVPVHHSCS